MFVNGEWTNSSDEKRIPVLNPATIGHCMSEALGPRFEIPHGFACTIMLPHSMDFNLPLVATKLRSIAEAFGTNVYGLTDVQAGMEAKSSVVSLMRSLEMPTALKDVSKFGKDRLFEMLEYVLNERQDIYNLPAYDPMRITRENLTYLFDDIWEGKFSTTTVLNNGEL